MVSQSTAMMSNPYGNQMFNPQMYQQQQPMMVLEPHQKPVSQMYLYYDIIFFYIMNLLFYVFKFNVLYKYTFIVLLKIQINQNLK